MKTLLYLLVILELIEPYGFLREYALPMNLHQKMICAANMMTKL